MQENATAMFDKEFHAHVAGVKGFIEWFARKFEKTDEFLAEMKGELGKLGNPTPIVTTC